MVPGGADRQVSIQEVADAYKRQREDALDRVALLEALVVGLEEEVHLKAMEIERLNRMAEERGPEV